LGRGQPGGDVAVLPVGKRVGQIQHDVFHSRSFDSVLAPLLVDNTLTILSAVPVQANVIRPEAASELVLRIAELTTVKLGQPRLGQHRRRDCSGLEQRCRYGPVRTASTVFHVDPLPRWSATPPDGCRRRGGLFNWTKQTVAPATDIDDATDVLWRS